MKEPTTEINQMYKDLEELYLQFRLADSDSERLVISKLIESCKSILRQKLSCQRIKQ